MSELLRLPDQLSGQWDHLLILSYGLDAVFFERMVLNQLTSRCRDRIILVDGRQYIRAGAHYADSALRRPPGEMRYLNRSYIAEGIFTPHAAHAKLILLSNAEQGRLLVGSGNLGWGYVSGGELFTQYDYTAKDPEALPAFLAAREFVEGILDRSYVSTGAEDRIRRMFGQIPWLYTVPPTTRRPLPIIHNLRRSILSQLVEAVGGEDVEELWLHAPFFDREAAAFERLLDALRPQRVHLLVQPGRTSVERSALVRVLQSTTSKWETHKFGIAADERIPVHAKFYLVKMAQRAMCLHGSPNLSKVALLLHDPDGNVELANLHIGPQNAFDDLLHALEVAPSITENMLNDPDYWNLEYRTGDGDADNENWYLTLRSGELRDNQLRLVSGVPLPSLAGAILIIGKDEFSLHILSQHDRTVELGLDPEAVRLLGQLLPVRLQWGTGDTAVASNPIFVCHRQALEETLQEEDQSEVLSHVGDLDIDDAEIEQLLSALSDTMIVDMPSLWKIAGKKPQEIEEDEQGQRLSYDDIDYDRLRQHPRMQGYLYGFGSRSSNTRSRIQRILQSIAGQFQGLTNDLMQYALEQQVFEALVESEAQSEEEVARMHEALEPADSEKSSAEQSEQERRQRRQRVRRLWMDFFQRFIKGFSSPRFQGFAGVEIMTRDYEIFAHLLARMLIRDWIEPETTLHYLIQIWLTFWGDYQSKGYFQTLSSEEKQKALAELRGYHADAGVLAALYFGGTLAETQSGSDVRFPLRDQLRAILVNRPFPLTLTLMEDLRRIVNDFLHAAVPLRCEDIVRRLASLASIETRTSLLRALEHAAQMPNGSLQFRSVRVSRTTSSGDAAEVTVDALCAKRATIPSDNDALELICLWMGREQHDYYRLMLDDDSWGFYDTRRSSGRYNSIDTPGVTGAIGRTPPTPAPWNEALQQLHVLARQLDDELSQPGAATGT